MVAYRVAGAALALLVLVAGSGRLSADDKKAEAGRRHDRLEALAHRLGRSSEQKDQIRKIHAKYRPKFRELAKEKGEKSRGQFRHLRHEEFGEVRHVLNEEQRAKLPGVLRSEFRQWRDPAKRRQLLKAFADRIG